MSYSVKNKLHLRISSAGQVSVQKMPYGVEYDARVKHIATDWLRAITGNKNAWFIFIPDAY